MRLSGSCVIQHVLDFCVFSIHIHPNFLPLLLTHNNVISKVGKSLACCLWQPSEVSLCLNTE